MDQLKLLSRQLLVLADGSTPAAISNTRGHLFELFVGKLLYKFGFEELTHAHVNQTVNGFELDVVVKTRLEGREAIAECKAYTRPVTSKELMAFFGKYQVGKFDNKDLTGLMMVIPGLTPDGQQAAKRITDSEKNFRYMDVDAIVNALEQEGLISAPPRGIPHQSDFAVVVTEHGIFSATIELDANTREPTRVIAWAASGTISEPAIALLTNDTYSQGLEVWDARKGEQGPPRPMETGGSIVLATVSPSRDDFQYQLPAAPRYFVGRKSLVKALRELLEGDSKVIVINAKSGYGKSSLALKFAEIVNTANGSSFVMDTRTASAPRYVIEVLRQAIGDAEKRGILKLSDDVSWASLASSLENIRSATWAKPERPVLIFFDQFENVFGSAELTRAFRDLALGMSEVCGNVRIGFAWKTDLVGWIEGHPYQHRDDIRGVSEVLLVEPFGSFEVNVILDRLERTAGKKLGRDLRSRLREYSQGLPWLIKKLADHVLRELRSGASPERLLAESLNVQSLFELDLAELGPDELEILKYIARFAPIVAGEVTDRYSPDAVQSLVNRRLIVQVGDRLDTYWDIFRDYLNTGSVPIQESYILRSAPTQVARMLPLVMKNGGTTGVATLAKALNTSENVIFNLARELRLFGITSNEPLMVRIADEIVGAADPEAIAKAKVVSALRRHRAFSTLVDVAAKGNGFATVEGFASVLPGIFPAISISNGTWVTYARAFISWFEYAGMVTRSGSRFSVHGDTLQPSALRLLSLPPVVRSRHSVPLESPGPSLALLESLANGVDVKVPDDSRDTLRRAIRTLVALHAVKTDAEGRVSLASNRLRTVNGGVAKEAILNLIAEAPGGATGLSLVRENPGVSGAVLGAAIRESAGAKWTESSTLSIGIKFRMWLKRLGVEVTRSPSTKNGTTETPGVQAIEANNTAIDNR